MDHSCKRQRIQDLLHMHACIWFLLVCVFGPGSAADLKSTVKEREGHNVSLGDTNEPSNYVFWSFQNNLIAETFNNQTTYHGTTKDRLYLEKNTGSLTIFNVSVNDSGEYERKDNTVLHQGKYHLNVTVDGVYPGVGETFTLYTGLSEVPKCSIISWNISSQSSKHTAESLCLLGKRKIRHSNPNPRHHLNQKNGSLTITNLKTTDSGLYSFKVLNNIKTEMFHLSVYARISQPVIIKNGTSGCWVLCTVKNGKELSLSWYRENERLFNISSPDLKIHLMLPLNIIAQDISTYRCMASNPVGNLTAWLNKDALCPGSSSTLLTFIAMFSSLFLILFGVVVFCAVKKRRSNAV